MAAVANKSNIVRGKLVAASRRKRAAAVQFHRIDGRDKMEHRTISISSKRQITIPQKYFEALGFGSEAECSMSNGALIIRPVRRGGGEFAEQILEELISQGYSGAVLLEKFKSEQAKIRPAVEAMLDEADRLAAVPGKGVSLDELFGAED